MIPRIPAWFVAVLLVAASAIPAAAQSPAVYELVLRDGTRVYGTIEQDTPERVRIRTVGGATMDVPRTEIVSLAPARGQWRDGQFLAADPNPTRLFFGPTGRALKKGESYVGVYELFLPFVQVGITDRLSIGGGTPLLLGDESERPFWVTPKFKLHESATSSTALGVLHFFNIDGVNFGVAYAATTLGSADDAATVGLGWAYVNENENNHGAVVAMLGGERRLSPRIKVITENYLFNGGGILSGGIRFIGQSLSADLGLFAPIGAGDFLALPIVNFVWKF